MVFTNMSASSLLLFFCLINLPNYAITTCSKITMGTPSCHFDSSFCSFARAPDGLVFYRASGSRLADPLQHDWQPNDSFKAGSYIYPLKTQDDSRETATLTAHVNSLVKAICIEFHYATIGSKNHTIRVLLESPGITKTILVLKNVKTYSTWETATVQPTNVPPNSKISFEVDNISIDSTVALDYFKITHANIPRQRPSTTGSSQTPAETTTLTPSTRPIKTSTRKSTTFLSSTTTIPRASLSRTTRTTANPETKPTCTSSTFETAACNFDRALCTFMSSPNGLPFVLAGGIAGSGPIDKDWQPNGSTMIGSYAFPMKLQGDIREHAKLTAHVTSVVKAMCIEFHYATTGNKNHTIRVLLESPGVTKTLLVLENVTTQSSWKTATIQPTCVPPNSKLSFEVDNISSCSTVALDYFKITHADMACQ